MFPEGLPLSLYIHLPWCIRKCPYCDFNSHASPRALPEQAYVDALLLDLEKTAGKAEGRPIESIFIGGGTPSLFSAKAIERLLTGVRQRIDLRKGAEITLEANPGAADTARFEGYLRAGVNRLSIGIQSFNEASLKALGRVHSAEEALDAVRAAQEAGVAQLNLDLMYGLPGQGPAEAQQDLETALSLGPTHLSYYQLTLEPETPFAKSPPVLPPDEAMGDIEQRGLTLLKDQGFNRYEVSAFARPGAECQHNQNYWTFGDYLGIGAGAHGKHTSARSGWVVRTEKTRHPGQYMKSVADHQGLEKDTRIDPENLAFEFLMNALRLRQGFSRALFEARTGLAIKTLEPTLGTLLEARLLEESEGTLCCTPAGYRHLDTLLQAFLPD